MRRKIAGVGSPEPRFTEAVLVPGLATWMAPYYGWVVAAGLTLQLRQETASSAN